MSKKELEEHRQAHNALIARAEKMPSGDNRHVLEMFIAIIRHDLIRASNLIESGQDPERVMVRLRKLFDNVKI